ncbi:MAG: hemerythrin domain-containing protein [Deltaproteobacteria bacterium]|nr:hemerythrin domain-containing protein [Deltaproteobacteria bacterium]
MSGQMIEVKYRCQREACCVNCKEGFIKMSEELFNDLASGFEGREFFKSPRDACRLGFTQTYKVVKIDKLDSTGAEKAAKGPAVENPISLLKDDHQEILKKLAIVEWHLTKRDVDGLWQSTCDLKNHLLLHSAKKEEEVLFPIMKDLIPIGDGLVAIMHEDHSEVLSLLHAFRESLEDGTILDSIIVSTMVGLKSHIRKEDYEFFTLLEKSLDDELSARIIEGMKKVEAEFVPIEPGDRKKLAKEKQAERNKRAYIDEGLNAGRQNGLDTCCGHG